MVWGTVCFSWKSEDWLILIKSVSIWGGQFSSSVPRMVALLTQSCGSFIQLLSAGKQNLMQNKELQTLCYGSLALSLGRIPLQVSSANKGWVLHPCRKAAWRHQLQWSQHKFSQRVTFSLSNTWCVSVTGTPKSCILSDPIWCIWGSFCNIPLTFFRTAEWAFANRANFWCINWATITLSATPQRNFLGWFDEGEVVLVPEELWAQPQ